MREWRDVGGPPWMLCHHGQAVPRLGKKRLSPYRSLTQNQHGLSPRRVPQEKQVRWASVATLALQGPLVNRASQALLEKRGQR